MVVCCMEMAQMKNLQDTSNNQKFGKLGVFVTQLGKSH